MPEHELSLFPEVHLLELPSFSEVELSPKPEIPAIPEFHFLEPEADEP